MTNKQQKNNFLQGGDKKSSPSILQRKCIACGKLFGRNQLVRLMCENKTKQITINPDNKTFGRSAYICQNSECFKAACKKDRFSKVLKTNIDESIIEKLKMMIN